MRAILLAGLLLTGIAGAGERLGNLSWPEAEAAFASSPLVILPFGAGAKEHGRHLPMNADRVFMEHLLDVAVERTDVLVAPPILYGWFPAFREFPSTGIEDASVFQDYVFLAARSLVRSGAQRIVFLNTGIGRATGLPISIAAREIRARCRVPTLVLNWEDLESEETDGITEQAWGGHADEQETAINLALQPDLVDLSKAEKQMGRPPKDYPGYRPGLMSRDEHEPLHAPDGIRGDPTLATADKGRQTLALMAQAWVGALERFGEESLPPIDRTCRTGDLMTLGR
ncbi:MAG: creatininase family protein [Pseudomonadota bacterium]